MKPISQKMKASSSRKTYTTDNMQGTRSIMRSKPVKQQETEVPYKEIFSKLIQGYATNADVSTDTKKLTKGGKLSATAELVTKKKTVDLAFSMTKYRIFIYATVKNPEKRVCVRTLNTTYRITTKEDALDSVMVAREALATFIKVKLGGV